jgi:O-antigen/teichoic acid export membrane protein
MDKAMEIGQVTATGSFKLFVGKMVSTLLLAVGTIILTLLISEGDYGLYAVALVPATTMLLFQDWGVGAAMVKNCAYYRATNQENVLRRTIVSGLAFEVVTGLGLTLLSFLTANFIGSTVFGKPESAFLIMVASISILGTSIYAGVTSVFIGFERMGLSSLTMIFQAMAQCFLAPLLVYLGYSALGAVTGFTVGTVVGCISAFVLLYFGVLKKLRPAKQDEVGKLETLKPMLQYGVPLAISTIVFGLSTQLYSFIMASTIADVAIIGNYRVAINFATLLTFFSVPIATVLFPAFSKLDPRDEHSLLRTIFTSSVKYSSLFLVPATLAIMVLSGSMIGTIYGDKWLYAPSFLTFYVVSNIFVILGNLSYVSLLQSVGETKMLMKLNILALCIGAPMAFVLIPLFGIFGLIFVAIVSAIPSMIIGVYWTWTHYGAKADLRSSGGILFSSSVAAAATFFLLSVFNSADWLRFVAGLLVFAGIYVFLTPLIGAINRTDVNNLRVMFSSLGALSKLLDVPLFLVDQVLKVRSNWLRLEKQEIEGRNGIEE